mmetsp:Transcript_64866/g.120678  ORF Transcript_64866/g.120678 Transcript_64866/m.120678 type:complete len:481 (-) Transcript_64866:31-1473(-)
MAPLALCTTSPSSHPSTVQLAPVVTVPAAQFVRPGGFWQAADSREKSSDTRWKLGLWTAALAGVSCGVSKQRQVSVSATAVSRVSRRRGGFGGKSSPRPGPASKASSRLASGRKPPLRDGEVAVVTWNLLSPNLVDEKQYIWNRPEDLDEESRLRKVLKRLTAEADRGAVITLQEVCRDWADKLEKFFQGKQYQMEFRSYGTERDGHMGVAIAIPTGRYKLLGSHVERLGGSDRLRPYVEESSLNAGGQKLEPWKISCSRKNLMLAMRLQPKSEGYPSFTVATYHMPCLFKVPQVMLIHASLFAQTAAEFAGDSPLILAADWNFKPGSAPYQLLTTGRLPANHPSQPTYPKPDAWRVDSNIPVFKSAYWDKTGSEPEFTNFNKVLNEVESDEDKDPLDEGAFIGTLDYIFVSEHLKVTRVDELRSKQDFPRPLPYGPEPSDHLMLAAVVRLEPKRDTTGSSDMPPSGRSPAVRRPPPRSR